MGHVFTRYGLGLRRVWVQGLGPRAWGNDWAPKSGPAFDNWKLHRPRAGVHMCSNLHKSRLLDMRASLTVGRSIHRRMHACALQPKGLSNSIFVCCFCAHVAMSISVRMRMCMYASLSLSVSMQVKFFVFVCERGERKAFRWRACGRTCKARARFQASSCGLMKKLSIIWASA